MSGSDGLPPESLLLESLLHDGIAAQQAAMTRGEVTAVDLVEGYLARIARLDGDGPRLHAVLEVNPDARELAAGLDAERAAGRARGPLHGIPVLLKDNIATGDRMATTAGSAALEGVRARHDAPLVARLRDAGAVVLGTANLSEWANIRSSRSTSGWSALGGLVRNPHALDRSASGSSSGSAAAVAASLASFAIGTETDGSITSPAAVTGVVGLKPTVGLVSRRGVVPISRTQDTAGPMTRSVADAALVLAAIADAAEVPEELQLVAPASLPDYADLAGASLAGVRLGLVRGELDGHHPGVVRLVEQAVAELEAAGASLVDVELPPADEYGDDELRVLLVELAALLPGWLAAFAPDAPVRDLADVVAFNRDHAGRELALFGQELFEQALELATPGTGTGRGLDDADYLAAVARCRALARGGLDAALEGRDALIAPTGGLAWLSDPIAGDHYEGSFSTPAAVAGYPHLTVPMGFVHGLPAGLSFVGPAWSEARLLRLGHAYETATRHRRDPAFAEHAAL